MESLNGSNESFSGIVGTVPPPVLPLGFTVAYHILLILVIIPVIFFNVLIIMALLVDRTTVGVLRFALCNIQAACLVVAVTMLAYDASGMVLAFTDIGNPAGIISFCRAVLFFFTTGGAARFLFLAVFSGIIHYIVKFHASKKKQSSQHAFLGFAFAVIVLWVVAILGGLPVLFDTVVNKSCGYTVLGGSISVALFVLIFGLGGFTASLTFLLLTVCYIRRHSISGRDALIKRALLKLGFFLLLGNLISVVGQIVPAIIGVAVSDSGNIFAAVLALYLAVLLVNLSLIPPPILLVIFFKPIRIRLRNWLCWCCLKTQPLEVRSSVRERSTIKGYIPSQGTNSV